MVTEVVPQVSVHKSLSQHFTKQDFEARFANLKKSTYKNKYFN